MLLPRTSAVEETTASSTPPRGVWRFAWLVAGACLLLTLPRLLLHELWRDEAWLWVVVGESGSLGDLWGPLSRSGQGYLFPLLCWLAHGVWGSWRAMQLLHLALAGAGAFVFARWAPFPRLERALFVLGYFPFYEYAVISRHYVLGALLLWVACVAARSGRPAIVGLALGLACQTTVYAFILAVAVAAGWLVDRWLRRAELPPLSRGGAAAGLLLGLLGALAGLAQLAPLPDTSFASGWRFAWRPEIAGQVLQMPWRALVPLPLPGLHFWNSNLLDAWPWLQAVLGVATVAVGIALLWPRRAAMTTFALGGAGLLAFAYVKFIGTTRHFGHWWLLLMAALWLGGGLFPEVGAWTWRRRTLVALLLVHVVAAGIASWVDLRQPFSNATRTAELLRARGLDRLPLLGYREPPAAPVSLALGKPLFAPSRGIFATHPDYGPAQHDLSREQLRCAARGLARREGGDVALVINYEPLPAWPEIEPMGEVLGAIARSEDYRLYRLHRDRLEGTAAEAACPRDG